MGNQLGLIACAGTMFVASQLQIEVSTWIYPIIYLIASLISQLMGGGGPPVGTPAPPLNDGAIKYLQVKGKGGEARPGTQGKVVVVEQWATWCGPCVHMVPHLNEIYEKYKEDPDFQLVGVTNETDESLINGFIEKHSMQYSVAIDANGVVSKGYPTQGIPNATIIGKDGCVFWNGHPSGMDKKLQEALSKTTATKSSKPSGKSTSKTSASNAKDTKEH